MRIRTTLLTGALLLASTYAMAQQAQDSQQTPQVKAPAGQTTDVVASPGGSFDFGFRAGTLDGDYARFARYQDYRDKQAGINFKWNREASDYFVKLGANNVGYYDQSFNGQFVNSKVHASFEWNQTPLFYGSSDVLKTPYLAPTISGGVATLLLPSATQQAIQNATVQTKDKTGYVTAASEGNSAVGIPTTVGQAGSGSLYRALAQGIDVRSRRDEAKFDFTYSASRDVDVKFAVNTYKRNGTQPWGASFSFNDAVELPLPIDNRTTDLEGHVEWANQQGMLKVGYEGSFFNNDITALVWSNPIRATDSWNGSSYSNAFLGGSSLGRMALAPNNHMNTVNATGLYKLPYHSSLNASLAVSSLQQNDALLPFTINSTLQPGTTVTVPGTGTWTLQAPDRATAEADVRLTVGTFNFTTRPNRYFGMTAKYRYSNWDNRTPIFENTYNVRFDGAPEYSPGSETEPGSIRHNQVDVDASFTPVSYAAFRVGYGHDGQDLTYRMFDTTSENTYRVSFDTIGNQYVTLRAKYESSKKTATGDLTDWYAEVGEHPGMAQLDIDPRNRKRGTLILDVAPVSQVGLSVSVFRGTDDYPGIQYGLLDNKNTGINFGVDLMPSNLATVSFYYGYEKYDALQASHNANPAPDPSWTDPARDWNLNNNERVDSYGANVELVKLIPKTEIRFGVDYSKSDQGFIYGGPRPAAMAAVIDKATGLPTFMPLPDIGNKLTSGSIDIKYFISPKIAFGANFLHQKYDVNDWSTPGTISNYVDPLGGLILGYGFRPYNVNVGGVRVIYLF